ncbi:MBL fold metallo-hydrolase [Acidiluteibacter ferrifornacis]|uniref:MBL fold metallo-hydrolase n=1 Tax=Acidiluteibacter ferrifornacis TaxID=2692424 RepID=A0A6N9NIV1_9FLAO|nr:MBL fold metallo-hydrolase [Acidiluteibacter ferrifornacis]NBG65421.1 hypothetical protein [Acidiluteibacter ferrifornacis]
MLLKLNIPITFSIVLLLFSATGNGQTNEIKIRFIGNCGLHLTDGNTHIYTDFPYKSGAHHYMEYDPTEIDNLQQNAYYLFTHKHSDHYLRWKMNGVMKAKNGKKYGKWNISHLTELNREIPDFQIQQFKTKHLFSFAHYSYLITWHGKRIYLSGDTESATTIGTVQEIDWAFIPAWLFMEAWENKVKIDAQMIGIYHIGPRDDVSIVGPQYKMFKQQGEEIFIPY